MSSVNLNIGGGLIEIATLATLIGASTSESLVLGTRGAAGLPVAAMSIFGSPFMIKACISAVTPEWLRETMGVKNNQADRAVGVSMVVNRVKDAASTKGLTKGVSLNLFNGMTEKHNDHILGIRPLLTQFVYTFDSYTSTILRNCPRAEHGAPTHFTRYIRTSFWEKRMYRQSLVDWLSILVTCLKLLEAFLLWRFGSIPLAILTSIHWIWFFMSALWLQSIGLSREYHNNFDSGIAEDTREGYCYDLLAGELPTVHSPGQHRTIIFSVPPNVREHFGWRIIWGVGALVCAITLVGTYVYIGAQPVMTFQIWFAFQILWLLCRTMFFHFSYETEGIQNGIMRPLTGPELARYRFRILSLISGVSRHQALHHSRGVYCYEEDIHDASEIHQAFTRSDSVFSKTLSSVDLKIDTTFWGQTTTEVVIEAVIGDAFLSSASWLLGKAYTSMDLYDCCLVILKVKDHFTITPAVRVLSGHVGKIIQAREDPEAGRVGEYHPKGAANDGVDIGWVFWIPLGGDQWLYHIGDLKFVGKRRMEVLSSREVTRRLHLAELFISLRDVNDVEETLEKSRDVGKMLMKLVETNPEWGKL